GVVGGRFAWIIRNARLAGIGVGRGVPPVAARRTAVAAGLRAPVVAGARHVRESGVVVGAVVVVSAVFRRGRLSGVAGLTGLAGKVAGITAVAARLGRAGVAGGGHIRVAGRPAPPVVARARPVLVIGVRGISRAGVVFLGRAAV